MTLNKRNLVVRVAVRSKVVQFWRFEIPARCLVFSSKGSSDAFFLLPFLRKPSTAT